MGKRGREFDRLDREDDVDMIRCESPPAKKSSLQVKRASASLGVLTHIVSDISHIPSPLTFFDQIACAFCVRRKYITDRGPHFVVGALTSNPARSAAWSGARSIPDRADALLVMMGSCEEMDYVTHLSICTAEPTVRILSAWAQTIRCVASDTDEPDDTASSPPASPLARFVRDMTGKHLHLACALTHCNMRPPFNTRTPPMMKLGGLANTTTLEDAVALSRVRRRSAQKIQRAYRRHVGNKVARARGRDESVGSRVLSGLLSELRL